MKRSSSRNKQPKSSTRNQSRSEINKNKSKPTPRNLQDGFKINAQKGVIHGKRTGELVKIKDSGLNHDGTEKPSDYFVKQGDLFFESDKYIINNEDIDEQQKLEENCQVSSLSSSQDDSDIKQRIDDKRDSLIIALSPEQSPSVRYNNQYDSDISPIQSNQRKDMKYDVNMNGAKQKQYEFQTNIKNEMKQEKEYNQNQSQKIDDIDDNSQIKSRKTSSFRQKRSKNTNKRNSLALSSIPKIKRFSGVMQDNQSDISYDVQEMIGYLSNQHPEQVAQNIYYANSLNQTPFTNTQLDDFEISLSESNISQHIQQDYSSNRLKQKNQKKQNNQNQEENDQEFSDLMKENSKIFYYMSQRKKMNSTNTSNNYLLDVSESRIHRSSKFYIHEIEQISPIQELNTQQSNKSQNQDINKKNRTEITIEPSMQQQDSEAIQEINKSKTNIIPSSLIDLPQVEFLFNKGRNNRKKQSNNTENDENFLCNINKFSPKKQNTNKEDQISMNNSDISLIERVNQDKNTNNIDRKQFNEDNHPGFQQQAVSEKKNIIESQKQSSPQIKVNINKQSENTQSINSNKLQEQNQNTENDSKQIEGNNSNILKDSNKNKPEINVQSEIRNSKEVKEQYDVQKQDEQKQNIMSSADQQNIISLRDNSLIQNNYQEAIEDDIYQKIPSNNDYLYSDTNIIDTNIDRKSPPPMNKNNQIEKNNKMIDEEEDSVKAQNKQIKEQLEKQKSPKYSNHEKTNIDRNPPPMNKNNQIEKNKKKMDDDNTIKPLKKQIKKQEEKQKSSKYSGNKKASIDGKSPPPKSNSNKIENRNKKIKDEASIKPLKKQINQQEELENSPKYSNNQNMEIMDNCDDIELMDSQRSSLTNKRMEIEKEGELYQVREDLLSQNDDNNNKRGKRKRITPEKNRQRMISDTSDTNSVSSLSSGRSYDSIKSGQSKSKQKSSQNQQTIIKKIKPRKENTKKQRQLELKEYQEVFEKGFHKDQVEVEVTTDSNSFGKDGRYPVRKRIRPLLSWRETAVYGSQGLLYIITDKNSTDLNYVNYRIPGFSNIPTPRPIKKDHRKLLKNVNPSQTKQLHEIKEVDETDIFKEQEYNNDKQDNTSDEKESTETLNIKNLKNNVENKQNQKSKLSKNEDVFEEIELNKQPKEKKFPKSSNNTDSVLQKGQLVNQNGNGQIQKEDKQIQKVVEKQKNQSLDIVKEEKSNIEPKKKDQKVKAKENQLKEQNNQKKMLKEDKEFIKQLFQDIDIIAFNFEIIETTSDYLIFTLELNPGQELRNLSSKYKIEIKVLDCCWKKLVIKIDDEANYLQKNDKKYIKKGCEFSIKYKEKNNQQSANIQLTCFKKHIAPNQSKNK